MKRSLLTRRQLAALKDLPGQAGPMNVQTITKWERAGCPVAERGRKGKPSLYDEAAVRAWLQGRENEARSGELVDLVRERAKKERAQRMVLEQQHAMRSGELLPRHEVEREWSAFVAAVRAKLLAWPTTVSDKLYRAATLGGVGAVERILDDAVRDALRELASTEAEAPAAPPTPPRRKAPKKKRKAASRRKAKR